jgi:hypothetical protein
LARLIGWRGAVERRTICCFSIVWRIVCRFTAVPLRKVWNPTGQQSGGKAARNRRKEKDEEPDRWYEVHTAQETPNTEEGGEDGAEAGVPESQGNGSTWTDLEREFVAIHFDSHVCVVLVGEKGRN